MVGLTETFFWVICCPLRVGDGAIFSGEGGPGIQSMDQIELDSGKLYCIELMKAMK